MDNRHARTRVNQALSLKKIKLNKWFSESFWAFHLDVYDEEVYSLLEQVGRVSKRVREEEVGYILHEISVTQSQYVPKQRYRPQWNELLSELTLHLQGLGQEVISIRELELPKSISNYLRHPKRIQAIRSLCDTGVLMPVPGDSDKYLIQT